MQHYHHNHHQDKEPGASQFFLLAGVVHGLILPGQGLHDGLAAGDDAVHHVAPLEGGQDPGLDDVRGDGVGQGAFQAITHLDTHLALVLGDEQQDAVILALLADAPVATELIAVLLYGLAIQAVDGDHHQLDAAALLEGGQLLGQLVGLLAGHQAGVIHHPPGQGREAGGGMQRRGPAQQAERQPASHQVHWKLTLGASSAPGLALNVGLASRSE